MFKIVCSFSTGCINGWNGVETTNKEVSYNMSQTLNVDEGILILMWSGHSPVIWHCLWVVQAVEKLLWEKKFPEDL